MDACQRRTPLSIKNEEAIQRAVADYDGKLRLRFADREGWYFLSRKAETWNDSEMGAVMDNGSAMFSDAAKDREVVVCFPIFVKMMENYPMAIKFIMKHLKEQNMKEWGESTKSRIRKGEEKNDAETKGVIAADKAKAQENIRAFGRDFYRHNLITKAYFRPAELMGYSASQAQSEGSGG